MKKVMRFFIAALLTLGLCGTAFSAIYEIYHGPLRQPLMQEDPWIGPGQFAGPIFIPGPIGLASHHGRIFAFHQANGEVWNGGGFFAGIGHRNNVMRGNGSFPFTIASNTLMGSNSGGRSLWASGRGGPFYPPFLADGNYRPGPKLVGPPLLPPWLPDPADGNGNSPENNGTAPVPEPGTMILLGLGLAGAAAYRRFIK